MKKMRITRMVTLILSLALLIGSAVGIAAAAEADGVYEIEATNIAHGDTVQVLIAVDAPIALADLEAAPEEMPAPDIEVKYTIGGKTRTATYWYYMNVRGGDLYYPVYYTAGIAAKDCGEAVLAEAHAKGVTPEAPLYANISAADYLYAKLFDEGYINMTEADGKDNDRKLLYLDQLEYIAAAQQVLWNDKIDAGEIEGEYRALVTERNYFGIRDGYANKYVDSTDSKGNFVYTYEDFASGAYTADGATALKLVYTGKNPNFKGWNVTKFVDGEIETSYVPTYRYVLDGGSVAIAPAFYTEAEATALNLVTYDESNVSVGDGWYVQFNDLNGDGKGSQGETEIIKSTSLPTRLTPGFSTNAAHYPTVGNSILVANDDANPSNYLRATAKLKTEVMTSGENRNMSIQLDTDRATATAGKATVSTIEFDMKMNKTNANEFSYDGDFSTIYIHAAGNSLGASGLTIALGTSANMELFVKINGTNHVAHNAKVNEWFRFKVELVCSADKSDRVLNFYADDVLIVSVDVDATGNTCYGFLKDFQFSPAGNTKFDLCIDRFTYSHEYQ